MDHPIVQEDVYCIVVNFLCVCVKNIDFLILFM